MTQEEIQKAFNGIWRIKGTNLPKDPYLFEQIKNLCRYFFEAGAFIAQASILNEIDPTVTTRQITTVQEANDFYSELDFDYWWNLYDKKRGREKCQQKWLKLKTEERRACIAATPDYVAATPDKQYRKDPLTYLNQKAWNDEIILKSNGESTKQSAGDKLADILVG